MQSLNMNDEQNQFVNKLHGPKSRQERLEDLIYKPDALDIMCSFVSNGGTLVDFAKLWDVRFSDLMRWIRKDKERTKSYEDAIRDRNEWTVETVLQELRLMATFDIRDLYDDAGNVKPISEWPKHAAAAVAGIEVNELFDGRGDEREMIGVAKKLKLWDKTKAIEQLGKTQKLFVDRVEETKVLKLEDLVLASYKNETTKV